MALMHPSRVCLSALLLLAFPAAASTPSEPLRILNGAPVPAVGLFVARSGAAEWGRNLLNQGPIAAGAAFALRMPEGSGCLFDIRLLLQDGREIVRRDADVCAERRQVLAPAAPPQAAAPAPRAGAGDGVLPAIQGARP